VKKKYEVAMSLFVEPSMSNFTTVPVEAADEETAEIAALQHLAWEVESVEEVEGVEEVSAMEVRK